MTNAAALTEIIKSSGLKLGFIASKLGIHEYSLRRKISNEQEFKASEIQALCNILGIEPQKVQHIFFAENGD